MFVIKTLNPDTGRMRNFRECKTWGHAKVVVAKLTGAVEVKQGKELFFKRDKNGVVSVDLFN